MEDAKLKCEDTPSGIYLYLELSDRDILLTKTVITDPHDRRVIEEFVNGLQLRLYAYRRYKAALNNILVMCKSRGVGGQIEDMITSVLNQFCDLVLPGTQGEN